MGSTIMVVDDASAIRNVVAMTLTSAGYKIIEACDGQDALRKLNGQQIDLIVCDVNMPNMGGVSLLHTVKNDIEYKSHRFTPFIMLTSEDGDGIKAQGKAEGAKAWLVKPFKPAELIDAVRKLTM